VGQERGGRQAESTYSRSNPRPFQSSVYARFLPTAATLFLPPLCVSVLCLPACLPCAARFPSAICTAICSEYTEGHEAGVRRSKLALCWRCLGSVRGLYWCIGRAVFLFKVCSNCSSGSARSRQLLQGEILCEFFFLSIDLLSTSIVPAYQRNYFQVFRILSRKEIKRRISTISAQSL